MHDVLCFTFLAQFFRHVWKTIQLLCCSLQWKRLYRAPQQERRGGGPEGGSTVSPAVTVCLLYLVSLGLLVWTWTPLTRASKLSTQRERVREKQGNRDLMTDSLSALSKNITKIGLRCSGKENWRVISVYWYRLGGPPGQQQPLPGEKNKQPKNNPSKITNNKANIH